MHTRAPASQKQFGSVNQLAQQPENTASLFTDNRQESNESKAMQLMMHGNPHHKEINGLQRKMDSSHLLSLQLRGKNIVQRAPIGAFAAAVPTPHGMFMDTANTVAHNSNVDGNANVAGRRIAVMRGPANGGVPSVDPHGWNWLRAKFLRLKGQWVRFHLINAKLGGSGANPLNLVPTTHALNHDANWRQIEEDAKTSANTKWTYLDVTPTYDPAYPAGIPRSIQGEWGDWDALNSQWITRGVMPATAQDNPVHNMQPYSDASALNLHTLKNLIRANMPNAKNNRKKIAKRRSLAIPASYKVSKGLDLLKNSYQSHYELETAWQAFLNIIKDEKAASVWYKIMNRVYLTEEGPAPWRLVYRK